MIIVEPSSDKRWVEASDGINSLYIRFNDAVELHAKLGAVLSKMVRPAEDQRTVQQVLTDAGFNTAAGVSEVLDAIAKASDGSPELRCSGFGVFPDGARCAGCWDCKKAREVQP